MKSLVFSLTVYTTAVGHIGSNNLNLWVYINCSLVTDVFSIMYIQFSLSVYLQRYFGYSSLMCLYVYVN